MPSSGIHTKGFTLLEVLIVLGIVVVLSATLVAVFNPAEILKKARDSQRLADVKSISKALTVYAAQAQNPDFDGPLYDNHCFNKNNTGKVIHYSAPQN